MKFTKNVASLLAVAALSCTAAHAGIINLVTNGNFEQTTNGGGQLDHNTEVIGWSTNGYNFVMTPGTAGTTGSLGFAGPLILWGPANGSNNGLTDSPVGGNFLAAEGDDQAASSPITQTINGLVAGQKYDVSFWWAGAQQHGFHGPNTEQWVVGLGSESQSTAVYQNPNHGFSGWMQETFTFTANSTSEVLSFFAVGTPSGVPPFALLDGVVMTASEVPEPSSVALVLAGIGLMGAGARLRRRRKAL